ncbi:helix-turn-helix domain-containing protein [Nibricoccus sp. IMCC34717]|uniref:helix-turn-helix domain-containing protein n=1 Tax=Nibricoccus sp. IMCC34717 TaxID=3034021 RepID=UPI00384C64B2
MRSAVHDLLPPAVRRSLVKLGADIGRARRKRRLTVAMMAERTGLGLNTYARIERGDGSVALSAYAMVLFVLGFGPALAEVADVRTDEIGLQLDEEQLPKRIRVKKTPTTL